MKKLVAVAILLSIPCLAQVKPSADASPDEIQTYRFAIRRQHPKTTMEMKPIPAARAKASPRSPAKPQPSKATHK